MRDELDGLSSTTPKHWLLLFVALWMFSIDTLEIFGKSVAQSSSDDHFPHRVSLDEVEKAVLVRDMLNLEA